MQITAVRRILGDCAVGLLGSLVFHKGHHGRRRRHLRLNCDVYLGGLSAVLSAISTDNAVLDVLLDVEKCRTFALFEVLGQRERRRATHFETGVSWHSVVETGESRRRVLGEKCGRNRLLVQCTFSILARARILRVGIRNHKCNERRHKNSGCKE